MQLNVSSRNQQKTEVDIVVRRGYVLTEFFMIEKETKQCILVFVQIP